MTDGAAAAPQDGAGGTPGTASTQEPDHAAIEARARVLGWKPKEEFTKAPEHWVDAGEFIERGEQELPKLRGSLHILEGRVGQLAKTNEALVRTNTELQETMIEFRDFAAKGEERAFQKAKRELEAQRNAAIASADVDGANAVQAEIDKLEEPKPVQRPTATATPPAATGDPVTVAWIDANPWFNEPELRGVAVAIEASIARANPEMTTEKRLAEVKRRTMAANPERFANERREAPAAVAASGGTGGGKPRGKSYNDLPAEAKKACDKFVKTIPGYTKEKYIASYDWSE